MSPDTNPKCYGVLVDRHEVPMGHGFPALWDGWYNNRKDAESALKRLRADWPDANVILIMPIKTTKKD
jgi:hypothetical protein